MPICPAPPVPMFSCKVFPVAFPTPPHIGVIRERRERDRLSVWDIEQAGDETSEAAHRPAHPPAPCPPVSSLLLQGMRSRRQGNMFVLDI